MSTVSPPADPAVEVDPDHARARLGGRRIGAHLPVRDGLVRAAERARSIGASAIQVFTDDPRGWTPRATGHPDAERFRACVRAWDIDLLVHASYLVNLASPEPEVHARSVERMRQELATAAVFGALAVNVHVGSHRGIGVDAGIERVADAIARILDTGDEERDDVDRHHPWPRLVLEVSAGQGGSLGVTVEELGAVLDAAERRGVDRGRLGVCLDTAHLWGAGYALDDPRAIDALLASVDHVLGPASLAMVHLNDSRAARGSRTDRHEHLGMGRIGEVGLGHLVRHPRLARVPMLLETPGMDVGWDAVDMARVRDLVAAEPGATPPAASVVPVEDGDGARTHMLVSAPEHA